MSNSTKASRPSLGVTLVAIAAATVALIPWMRNRGYINDLLDYGLVIVGNARVAAGERPWVDFTTPLQSGFYWLNHVIQRLFGDTFQAMTLANGVAIVAVLALTAFVLSKRLPAVFALLISLVIVVGSLGQHTVVWYNAVGVIALAYVSWSAAVSPVLHRSTFWWHALTIVALAFGGTNKLNFHLVGLAGAVAWAIRAGCLQQAKWGRVGATVLVWLVAGIAVPLGLELAWTGATFAEWRYNVLEIAVATRGGHLTPLLGLNFYIKPLNDFYGWVLGPVGAIVVIWLFLSAALAWKGRNLIDRVFLVGATLYSIVGFAGIMATNHEIVYVSLSAGIAILISIWLGFDLMARPRLRGWVLLVPCLILGAVMWKSAWQGQRALFGHNVIDREAFRELKSINGEFDYMKGTHLPPTLAQDLEDLATEIPAKPTEGEYPFFYSTGMEWLEMIWPAKNLKKMPILHTAVAYTPIEVVQLREAFSRPSEFERAYGMVAWGPWPGGIESFMSSRITSRLIGGITVAEIHNGGLTSRLEPFHDAIAILNNYGGSMDRRYISIRSPLWSSVAENEQAFLSTESGEGVFRFEQPTINIRGQVIVRRITKNLTEPLEAEFEIRTVSPDPNQAGGELWRELVKLPADQNEVRASYDINTQNLPTEFSVRIPAEHEWKIAAGWRLPNIQYTKVDFPEPPILREPPIPVVPIDASWKAALLPAPWRDKFEVQIRGGFIKDQHIELWPGGEVWLRPIEPVASLQTRFRLKNPVGQNGALVVRAVWYKGGRLEIQQQMGIHDSDTGALVKTWTAGSDGFFGFLIDPGPSTRSLQIKIEEVVGLP